ncbi:OLC1v1016882C4 [Oldenlandia corymbosa var. corymbosa]|uniref:OLC1v1016882C4 n=1 Tax=Oldenlandia corymbosa var. corymbosa TaxID=529605 RepID=A0AAV1E898_OLDCO|nr:OLC1v1016882C4 [Oldenlandia corymbosa var. corymbosa]
MDLSTSEYSSGCASGWTMYLDPFSSSNVQWNRSMEYDNDFQSKGPNYVDEDEEDLSMLSDASSGPPHFHHDEDSSEETRYNSTMTISESKRSKNRMKVKEKKRNQPSYHHLDDTASSHVLSYSKHVIPACLKAKASLQQIARRVNLD